MTAFNLAWQNINNTLVLGKDAPAVSTLDQGGSAGSGLASSNNALTYVIKQGTAADGTSSMDDILQLQSGGVNRFMVAYNGAVTINATVADSGNLFVIKNNGSEQFAINAKGDVIVKANLIVKKDIASLGAVLGSTSSMFAMLMLLIFIRVMWLCWLALRPRISPEVTQS
jgi:hypothetical protein